MKKNDLKLISFFLVAALFMFGCQKETLQSNEEIAALSLAQKPGKGNGCRVTSFDYYVGITDEHQIDQYTYKDGLVDEWKTWYGMNYKLEYDEDDKLKIAKGYDGADLVYNIHFFYSNNRVVKEIWYEGNSDVVADDFQYTFDRKGQIVKGESTVLDYYTENVYTPQGDLESWKFYQDGVPVVSGHYTYANHYKSPLRGGTPGVEYNFPYSNSTFGQTKWWYSSEKILVYDEFGVPSVNYDQDPDQTQWQTGSDGTLDYVDYVDRPTGVHFSVGFGYENCRQEGTNNSGVASTADRTAKMLNPLSLLQRNPSKPIKEQVKELRRQVKRQQQ